MNDSHGGRIFDRTRRRSIAELGVVVVASIAFFFLCAATNAYDRLQRWGNFQGNPHEADLLLALPFALMMLGLYAARRYHEARDHAARLADAERALERTNQEYRSLFDHHPHGVFALDAQRTYRHVNGAAETLGGYTSEELLGRRFPVLIEPAAREDILADYQRALAGDVTRLQAPIIRKDGARREVDLRMLPTVVEGETVGVYVVLDDVTEDNRLRAELNRALAEAQEANDAKTLLLANVSHELRTPLASVLAATEMLHDPVTEEQHANLISIVDRNGRALLKLVEDLLDLTRLETGQLVVERVDFDLRAVVNQATSRVLPKAEENDLALEVEIDESLPHSIPGDPLRVGQILAHLLGNAVKFTDKGSIKLHVRQETHAEPPRVVLTVRDTGVGITPADQERIFDHFVQADPTTTRRHGGAGLGLTITRQLVKAMGGDIVLHSEVGLGTTVTVRLPLEALPGSSTESD